MDGGGYLPECNLQAGYQDRLQLWGRELASQHSGELLVSSSADHSEAEPRRGENKSAMFSYTNQWAGGKYKCHTHLLSAALRRLFPDSGRPRACLPLHVFNIDCCQTGSFFFLSPLPTLLLKLSAPFLFCQKKSIAFQRGRMCHFECSDLRNMSPACSHTGHAWFIQWKHICASA